MPKAKPSRTKMLVLAMLTIIGAIALACTPSHNQSTFDTLGPVAENQAFIFIVIFWVGAFVFVAVEGALIYAVFKFKRRPGDGDPVQVHGNTRLEIAWTIAPIIILIIAAVPTVQGIFYAAEAPIPPSEGGLEVDAIGHQWWFEFRYPHPDNPGEQIVFANELHIPFGEPVTFNLGSVDVINSLWVPKLAGKVDMIPNNDNSLWLQADEPGVFFGQCAEFCGVSHANMKFKVVAESRSEFDAWLQSQSQSAFEPAEPLAVQGKELFKSAGCTGCHATKSIMKLSKDGKKLPGRIGPNLTHMASRINLVAMLDNTEIGNAEPNDYMLQRNLKDWISNPEEIKPGNIMSAQAAVYTDPSKALEEHEIDALVAYLLTLK